MHRKLIVLIAIALFALAPFGASAQTTKSVWVSSSGQAATSAYFYTSDGCSTSAGAVTYMYRGGPSYRASGLTPSSGSVYEEFNAVGSTAWGKAYYFNDASGKAFEFWFQGGLTCRSATSGTVMGLWNTGYAYATDPATGQLLCTKLSGRGYAYITVDFQRKTTSTTLYGSYTAQQTVPCS